MPHGNLFIYRSIFVFYIQFFVFIEEFLEFIEMRQRREKMEFKD